VGFRPFHAGSGCVRALVYFVLCGACALSVGQTVPSIPDFVELPNISEKDELIPLRPFLLESDHNSLESANMRGKSVRQGPSGWILEYGTIESGDRLLLADHIKYNPKTNDLEASGNIRFEGSDFRMYCDKLNMNWDKKSGEAIGPRFELPQNWIVKSDKVKFKTLQKWDFDKVTLSPGVEEVPGWKTTSSRLKIDLDHYAHFENLWVWVFGFPTYYFMPYLKYPVKSQRVSGFLPVALTSSSIGIPYYKTFGKSVDATLFPRFFGKNGILWEGEFRWSPDQEHRGSTGVDFIKQHEDSRRRYSFSIQELWQREDGWRFAADINRASDNLFGFDYDKGIFKLGDNALSSAVYLGKNFSWGNASISTAQQKTHLPLHNILVGPNFASSIKRETLPSIQGTINPITIGSFYVDGDIRFDRLSYNRDVRPSREDNNYNISRNDIFLRASKSLNFLCPLKTNIRFGGRLTNYPKTLKISPYDTNIVDNSLSKAGSSVNRVVGSVKIDVCAPAVSRILHGAKLSNQLQETKHIVTPHISFLSSSNSFSEKGYLPNFDGVDSQPGISGSAMGEQSLEVGIKQHFLCRSNTNVLFLDLFRWNIAFKYYLNKIIMPDGKEHQGWGSLNNDIDLVISRKLRINFRQNTSMIGGSPDNAMSIDYGTDDSKRWNLALFLNGTHGTHKSNNKLHARPGDIQLGGTNSFYDDKIKLELLCGYDVDRRSFASVQLAVAYVRPCVSESISFYRVSRDSVLNSSFRGKENRLVFTISLRNLGDLFKF